MSDPSKQPARRGRQPLVAIVGTDGSGKSTVIEALRRDPQLPGRGPVVIAPRYKRRGDGAILNYGQPARSSIVSSLKISWRAVDWYIRYYLRYVPLMRRGYLILCDRYYFDELLVDPRKYRYGGPAWLVMFFRQWLPRPDVYILLDAAEEVLYQRKQEVTYMELAELRQAYMELLRAQPCSYCVDASAPLSEVVGQTRAIILECL